MGHITEIPNTKWRDDLLPASFKGSMFYVETGSLDSGRRTVVHEFPKKELPYAEDMGRRAVEFSVRAYIIAYPHDNPSSQLKRRDYRIARDRLHNALITEGAGVLQLPTIAPMIVVCPRFRLTEEEKLGGYCVFDIQFVEFGLPPFAPLIDTRTKVLQQSQTLKERVLASVAAGTGPMGA